MPASPPPRVDAERRRILLVEDNPSDVYLFRHFIEEAQPQAALEVMTNGLEALTYLQKPMDPAAQPHLVVLDLNLPLHSGFEVLASLRSRKDPRAYTPVVVLSTSYNEADIQRSYEIGANAYLVKTHDLGDYRAMLAALVSHWLSNQVVQGTVPPYSERSATTGCPLAARNVT